MARWVGGILTGCPGPRLRSEMDEKAVLEALKENAGGLDGLEVHDWPFEEEADKAFYLETEDHKRFAVHVAEVGRFQAGNVYF